ncbi:Chaperonin-like RBCX protein 1, chloroplastic [Coccomyxa sp. Obi]|nr:Chaperonin-like RBCX protein 1, chloroplastic [Coccomyxa sp. Obi]
MGMYVPSDSFGGKSPEKKASDLLRTLFTFCAAKIVMAQLEGSGRGGLGSYNTGAYQDLTDFLHAHPMRDGDTWLELLLKKNEMLALRVLEVRKAYCEEDFEWDICRQVAAKDMHEANVRLLRSRAEEAFLRSNTDTPGTPPV